MQRILAIALVICSAASCGADVVGPIYADLSAIGAKDRPFVRYLDLSNIPEDKREEVFKTLGGHINALSRETDLASPAAVKGGLVRIDLRDYGWDAKVWEKFRDIDPYFHVQIVKDWPGGDYEGKPYDKGSFKVSQTAGAPWLAETDDARKKLTAILYDMETEVPVLRADWWFAQTAVQEGRKVGYYDLLGIKAEKDYHALIRFDPKLSAKLEHRRAVVFSGITLQPRRVERTPTVLGGLWRSFDNSTAVAKANPHVFLDDEFTFEATEQFAPLPNGLPVWWLANGKGERQDKAPDNIVGGDRTTHSNDTRLQINLSCIRCHFAAKDEMGIKPIVDKKIGRITAKDYDKLRELQRQYLRALKPSIESDQRNYETAIKQATGGMTGQEWATAYAKLWSWYEDAKVDLTRAAGDLGCKADDLKAGLERQEKTTGNLHPMLSIILAGDAIPIRQWEEVYPLAQTVIRGVQP